MNLKREDPLIKLLIDQNNLYFPGLTGGAYAFFWRVTYTGALSILNLVLDQGPLNSMMEPPHLMSIIIYK